MSLIFFFLVHSLSMEIERGPMMEIKSGGAFFDKHDKPALNSGLRLSYILSNPTDSFFTLELEGDYERIFKDQIKQRYVGRMNFAFYELYSPFAFRFATGPLVERRSGKFSAGGSWRLGLGYYWSSRFGSYIDYGARLVSREADDRYNLSFTNDLTLGLQLIL